MDNVYEAAEAMIRQRLQGRRSDFVERCVTFALWILRTHGPHGYREFALYRRALGGGKEAKRDFRPEEGSSKTFRRPDDKPLLTSPQIRTAIQALRQIGVIVKTKEQRRKNAWRYYADAFVIGMEFASLFSEAKTTAPQAQPSKGKSPREIRIQNESPLVRATSQNPIPKPFQRQPRPKTFEDYRAATREWDREKQRIEDEAQLEYWRRALPTTPIKLSSEALRSVLDSRYRCG